MLYFSKIILLFALFNLTSAVYYRNLPYSTKIINSRLHQQPLDDQDRGSSSSQLSPPPAHLFVLRPDYALRNINKVANVFRNFFQKRLNRPNQDLEKRASKTLVLYDY